MEVKYDAIFEWKMSSLEISAYKLAVLYEEEYVSIFKGDMDGQGYRRNTLPKRSDPRKSNLFRHCWKLRRETRGLLEGDQYRQYIRANLTILKLNQGGGDKAGHVYIEPNAICGDKAWIRWKVYERWYQTKLALTNSTPPPPSISSTHPKVIKEIDRTKRFLFEKCEGEPTKEKLCEFVNGGFFKFWIMTGKISKFYVVLSPFMEKHKENLAKSCEFDLVLINERITNEVREYFGYEYKHEFEQKPISSFS